MVSKTTPNAPTLNCKLIKTSFTALNWSEIALVNFKSQPTINDCDRTSNSSKRFKSEEIMTKICPKYLSVNWSVDEEDFEGEEKATIWEELSPVELTLCKSSLLERNWSWLKNKY